MESFYKRFVIILVILVAAVGGLFFLSSVRKLPVVEGKSFYKIPMSFGKWRGEEYKFDDYVYETLNADENVARIYSDDSGNTIGFYIGYYGTRRGGHPEHVPTGCYPGAGWGIEDISPLDINLDNGKVITVHNLFAVKGSEKEATLYWVQNFRGTVFKSGIVQNLEKLKTRLFYNRNDGAFIRINSRLNGRDRGEAVREEVEFIKEVYPYIESNWPVEK